MMDEALFPLAYFLRPDRVEKNIRTFVQKSCEDPLGTSPSTLKKQFLQTVHKVCERSVPVSDDSLDILFESDEIFEMFISKIRPDMCAELRDIIANNPYSEAKRALICKNIQKALNLLQATAPDLYQSVYYFLSRIYCVPSKILMSGSKGHFSGFILFCPNDTFIDDVDFYAEALVHEALHQVVFLDHAVHQIYDDPEISGDGAELSVVGALSLEPYMFEIGFESLVVAATNQYQHILSNNHQRAHAMMANYNIAFDRLDDFIEHFKAQNRSPLSKNGFLWLQALKSINWKKLHEISKVPALA
jgi:hypothetical protein